MRVSSLWISGCVAAQVTPVEKVVNLLAKLQQQVEEEGKKEAASYDKYACFCKEQADDKQYVITKSKKVIDELSAQIEDLDAKIGKLNTDVTTKEGNLGSTKTEITTEQGTRDTARAAYEKEAREIAQGIDEIKRAIKELKASEGKKDKVGKLSASLTQAVTIALMHPSADLTADEQKEAIELLQAPDGKPAAYKTRNKKIIELLTKLLQVFKEKQKSTDDEETSDRQTFEMAQQKRHQLKKSLAKGISQAQATVAELSETKAQADSDKTAEESKLAKDQKYLDDLTAQCSTKASEWDTRSQSRAAELTAIATALEILKGGVASNYGANKKLTMVSIRSAVDKQMQGFEDEIAAAIRHSVQKIKHVADVDAATHAAATPKLAAVAQHSFPKTAAHRRSDSKAAAEEDAVVAQVEQSFVQLDSLPHQESGEVKALRFLMMRAKQLKSTSLAAVATLVGKDPFKKVRDLINDLITKLEDEATAEATEKDFCEEEMGKETTNRDTAKTEQEKTEAKISRRQAKIKSLKEEIASSEQEIVELNQEAKEALALREEEKADNEQTLADAKEGLEAVKAAITVLNQYYAKNGEFLQEEPAQPVEGTPEEYKSSDKTSQANQVVGFLEVIKADFERTITVVGDSEMKSQGDYDTEKSGRDGQISAAQTAVETKSGELGTEKTGLFDDDDELSDHKKDVAAAEEALEKLKPQCVDQSVSYEERAARRKQEIESLKEALSILEESTANLGFLQS